MVLTYLFNPFQRRLVFLRSTGMKMALYKLKNCLKSSCSQCWDLIQLSYTNTRHFSIIQSLLGIEWDEIQFSFMLHMANFWDKSGLEVENDTNTKNSRAISHFSSSSTYILHPCWLSSPCVCRGCLQKASICRKHCDCNDKSRCQHSVSSSVCSSLQKKSKMKWSKRIWKSTTRLNYHTMKLFSFSLNFYWNFLCVLQRWPSLFGRVHAHLSCLVPQQ